MAYVSELCGKKHRAKMAATLNESVATGPSEFAKNQLKLMGWKEGEGLGKNRQGIATHIKVEKRKEAEGLGHERQLVQNATNQWWTASIGETLSKLQKPKKDKKSKKRKREKVDDSPATKTFTDEELFAATGGARFGTKGKGRRSEGKWARSEKSESFKVLEEKAKKQMEWNGLGKAKLVNQEI